MINFWKIYEKQSDKRNDYEKEYFDCVVTKGNLKNNTDMEGSHLNHIKHDIADANNVVEPGPINSSRCEPCCRTGKCVGAGCDVTFINYRCNHNPNGHNSHCRRVNRFLCGKCDNESNMTEQEKADAVAYSYDYMEERVSDDDDADADTESDTTFVVEDAQAEDAQAEDAQADDVQAEDAQVDDDNTTDTESDTTFVVDDDNNTDTPNQTHDACCAGDEWCVLKDTPLHDVDFYPCIECHEKFHGGYPCSATPYSDHRDREGVCRRCYEEVYSD